MVIVSSDKEKLVNFDSVVALWIDYPDYDTDNVIYTITAETDCVNVELGKFKSLERAKEILNGIMEFYIGHLDCYAIPEE